VIAAAGCGCAPATVVRWSVVAALVLGAVALVLGAGTLATVSRGRARRALETTDPAADRPAEPTLGPAGARPRTWPRLSAGILLGLAVVVAAAGLSSTLSLAALVAGAVVASVGLGATTARRRPDAPSTDGSAPSRRPGPSSPT